MFLPTDTTTATTEIQQLPESTVVAHAIASPNESSLRRRDSSGFVVGDSFPDDSKFASYISAWAYYTVCPNSLTHIDEAPLDDSKLIPMLSMFFENLCEKLHSVFFQTDYDCIDETGMNPEIQHRSRVRSSQGQGSHVAMAGPTTRDERACISRQLQHPGSVSVTAIRKLFSTRSRSSEYDQGTSWCPPLASESEDGRNQHGLQHVDLSQSSCHMIRSNMTGDDDELNPETIESCYEKPNPSPWVDQR